MSSGRKALPATAFSTAGISTRKRTFRRAPMIMCAQREHGRGAAHVLFHDQHGAVGLDVEAAGVETHALADQRDLRIAGFAPGEIDQPRRAPFVGGAADGVDERKVLFQQVVADDGAGFRAPVLLGECAGGGFELPPAP